MKTKYLIVLSIVFGVFTAEEIDNMKSELEKYGIQMPAFGKIGGILASELSVDEAACEHRLVFFLIIDGC